MPARLWVGMEPLDAVAADLRERLLAGAGDGAEPEALPARIRSLVDREAGVLDEGRRAQLAARIAERAFGLGPLEPLLADPAVDEVMVSGTAPVWVERGGRLERTDARFGSEQELRDAIERILAPLGRRVDEAEPLCDARLPDGSRVNVVIPPLALDGPALTIRRFRRRGFSREDLVANGHAAARAARPARARRAGALHGARLRRHRLGQDDDAQRAVELHRRRRARRHDRGRRRAAAAPAARRAPGGAAAEPRGPRRGDDPPARAQRAADAAGPDRRRRGPRAGGARHADRDDHRPRRLAVHRPRRLAGGGAAPRRDARADGRRRAAARRDARAGRRRVRPRGLPGARGRRRAAGRRGRRGRARGRRRRRARALRVARRQGRWRAR